MAYGIENHLAPYAVRSCDCGGRTHPESDDPLRGPFELDRHRIIESTAFRRLEHKTQVFTAGHHDHFRTRLTHTLEAAQIARCLAGALRANEALAEAITLAHDLGHPPFGHAGETALNEAMATCGGFNHNTHSLRVVEYLEHPFPPFRGLNLTGETRTGLATHATRYDKPKSRAAGAPVPLVASPRGPSSSVERSLQRDSLSDLPGRPSVEAQIASMADRIAYNCHDLEDAIGAGFVGLKELTDVELWQDAYARMGEDPAAGNIHRIRRVVLDAVLNELLTDVISMSQALLPVGSPDEARAAERPLVVLSTEGEARLADLEHFMSKRVYQHSEIIETDIQSRWKVLALVIAYRKEPDDMPARFTARIDDQGLDRVICDYVAGMTDRFCQAEYDRLFPSPTG